MLSICFTPKTCTIQTLINCEVAENRRSLSLPNEHHDHKTTRNTSSTATSAICKKKALRRGIETNITFGLVSCCISLSTTPLYYFPYCTCGSALEIHLISCRQSL